MNPSRMRVILALDGSIDRSEVDVLLPAEAGVEVTAVVNGSGLRGDEPAADMVVVACGDWSEQALGTVAAARASDPSRPVVVLYRGTPNGFVRRAFEAGAADIVTLPNSAESVLFALEKAVARGNGGSGLDQGGLGRLICILGPKGGTGKTLTTSNLAVCLAQMGANPIIVDLDLQFGDVGLSLALPTAKTIYDLAASGGSLDEEKLESYLAVDPSGARALLAPLRPDHAGAVTIDLLRDVFRVSRAMSGAVIVDTPPDFTAEVIAAVDASTDLCMVGMLDALSLKNTKIGLETLARMGKDPAEVTVLLNRADSDVGIAPEDVRRVLGRDPDVMIPSDRNVALSVNTGEPIVSSNPRSEAAKAFRDLAASLIGEQVVEDEDHNEELEDSSRRWLSLRSPLFGRTT